MGLAGKEAGSGGATHCPTDPPLPDSPAAQHSLICPIPPGADLKTSTEGHLFTAELTPREGS